MRTEINFNKRLGILGRAAITFPGGSGPAPFESTKSLSFDGTDEYVNLGNPTSLQITGSLTLSAWIKTTSTSGFIIAKEDALPNSSYSLSVGTSMGNNFIRFRITSGGSLRSVDSVGIDPADGQWHHVLGVNDGSNLLIYIDGTLRNSNFLGGSIDNSTADVNIGRRDYSTSEFPFTGNIDEVAIFNSALSFPDVTTIYNGGVPNDLSSLSPVSWWRMGENSTFASPQILMPENSNKDKYSNYSLKFGNGFTYFITSSVFDVLDGASQVTISFWLNSPLFASTGEEILWIPITTTSRSLQIKLRSDGQIQAFVQNSSGGTSRVYSIVGGITANSWYHVMLTFDLTQPVGSKAKIFINGLDQTLAGQNTINITSITPAGDGMAIGANRLFGSFGGYYQGKLTQFAIWNNSNLQSQASAIYNSGTPTDISSLSPTVYYKFGEGTTFNTVWEETDSASSGFNLTGGPDFDRIGDRVGDAPNSENNALSINMEEADIVEDAPV